MQKEKFEELAINFLSERTDEAERKNFEKVLSDNPLYRPQFDQIKELWDQMDNLEDATPSERMDNRFYEMLSEQKHGSQRETPYNLKRLISLFQTYLMRPHFAYGLLLLLVGFAVGYYANTERTDFAVHKEVEEVRKKLVLTLLEQSSANERLEGVNEVNNLSTIENDIIDALLNTLNNDPNVNVRLAAMEALAQFSNHHSIREGLVQSIKMQDSPIVQVSMANLMVMMQEKKSVPSFKELMQTRELNESVKHKIENAIQLII